MSGGEYLVGLGFFCVTAGSSLAATFLLLGLLPTLRGAERCVAFGIVGTAAVISVHMLPGILGVLTRWTVAATSLLLLAVVVMITPRLGSAAAPAAKPEARPDDPVQPESRFLWVAAAAAAAAYALAMVLELRTELIEPANTVDTTTFHLPEVASWIRSESLWGIHQFIPLQAHANYPQNGDVIHLATVLPWRNDAFARPIGWVFVALIAFAVYALARRTGATRPISCITSIAFASVPALILSTTSGTLTDPILIAMFGAGLVFLARHAETGSWSDLILAGLGLGLAFGTKWYGVSSVIATLVLWSAWRFISEPRKGLVIRQIAALTGLVALAGGFWFLRNWVGSGNPVFPVNVEAFGLPLFSAPADTIREQVGFSISDYLGDTDLLTGTIADALWSRWSLIGCLLLTATAAAALIAAPRWRGAGRSWTCFLICLTPLLLGIYAITPYTALGFEGDPFGTIFNVRYSLPALITAVASFAWLTRRIPATTLPLAIAGLLGIVLGIREGFEPSRSEWAVLAVAALTAGLTVLALTRVNRPIRLGGSLPVVVGLIGALGVALVGYDRQREFNDDRYEQDPVLAWISDNAPEGHKVGLDGEWTVTTAAPVLPAFGPRFHNGVEYIGSMEGFLTPYRSERTWQDDVEAGGYDLIVVGRLKPRRAGLVVGWGRDLGFKVVATSPNLLLLEKAT